MKLNRCMTLATTLCFLHAGAQSVNTDPLRRVIMFSVRYDPSTKQAKLQSLSETWYDPSEMLKFDKSTQVVQMEATYDVELLLTSGRTIRNAAGGGPGGVITSRGLETTMPYHTLHAAICTEEDSVGLRIYNHRTGERLAEERFEVPKVEPKIRLGGDLFQDTPSANPIDIAPPTTNEQGDRVTSRNYTFDELSKAGNNNPKTPEQKPDLGPGAYFEVDRPITGVSIKLSADDGRTWMHFLEGTACKWAFGKAFPAERLNQRLIFSVNVFIGMKVYRRLFCYGVETGFQEIKRPFVPPSSHQIRMTWEELGKS